jgi:hypothetical protein
MSEKEILDLEDKRFGAMIASLNLACRNPVPAFPQRSPPLLLTTAACGGLRSAPDCRPRRTFLHLSYSYATPFGPAILVTHDPLQTSLQSPISAREAMQTLMWRFDRNELKGSAASSRQQIWE